MSQPDATTVQLPSNVTDLPDTTSATIEDEFEDADWPWLPWTISAVALSISAVLIILALMKVFRAKKPVKHEASMTANEIIMALAKNRSTTKSPGETDLTKKKAQTPSTKDTSASSSNSSTTARSTSAKSTRQSTKKSTVPTSARPQKEKSVTPSAVAMTPKEPQPAKKHDFGRLDANFVLHLDLQQQKSQSETEDETLAQNVGGGRKPSTR